MGSSHFQEAQREGLAVDNQLWLAQGPKLSFSYILFLVFNSFPIKENRQLTIES